MTSTGFLPRCLSSTRSSQPQKNCFISAVAGPFYGRLFPSNSLHFVHSSFSLHWLSKVPEGLTGPGLNKGKIYISDTSPESAFQAYLAQFESDFYGFMKARAEEVVPGGKMVLYFIGRKTPRPSIEGDDKLEILSRALMSMASEGLIKDKDVDSFNYPYYAPSVEEVKKVIAEEGSFVADAIQVEAVEWERELEASSRAGIISRTVRASNESILGAHFGSDNMDELYSRLHKLVEEAEPKPSYIMIVSLTNHKSL